MRMTSRLRSLRLCAFSVLSARMRNASPSSGETSAVICLSPSTLAAASRCRPFGVQNPPSSPRTTMIGSRNDPRLVDLLRPGAWCASARGRAGTASAARTRAAAPQPARCCRTAARGRRRSARRRARAPARRAPRCARRRARARCPRRRGRASSCPAQATCDGPRSSWRRLWRLRSCSALTRCAPL